MTDPTKDGVDRILRRSAAEVFAILEVERKGYQDAVHRLRFHVARAETVAQSIRAGRLPMGTDLSAWIAELNALLEGTRWADIPRSR
jgi:hypothetical protein